MALDTFFESARAQVEQLTTSLPRHAQVRVTKWLQKLSQPVANSHFKRERNAYISLLLSRVQQEIHRTTTSSSPNCNRPTRRQSPLLSEPFDKLPRDEALPKLPAHLRVSVSVNPREPRKMAQLKENTSFGESRVAHPRTRQLSPRVSNATPSGPNYVVLYQEAQGKIQKLEETIARLEQELENERTVRLRDRKRLTQLHQSEIEELRSLHDAEMARTRSNAGDAVLMQRSTPCKDNGRGLDDDSFLRYAEEFQARSESLIKKATS